MDEVFGQANFVAAITFLKTSYATSEALPVVTDYLLWYAPREMPLMKLRKLYFNWLEKHQTPGASDDDFQSRDLASAGGGSSTFDFEFQGKSYHPGANRHWKTNKAGLDADFSG